MKSLGEAFDDEAHFLGAFSHLQTPPSIMPKTQQKHPKLKANAWTGVQQDHLVRCHNNGTMKENDPECKTCSTAAVVASRNEEFAEHISSMFDNNVINKKIKDFYFKGPSSTPSVAARAATQTNPYIE